MKETGMLSNLVAKFPCAENASEMAEFRIHNLFLEPIGYRLEEKTSSLQKINKQLDNKKQVVIGLEKPRDKRSKKRPKPIGGCMSSPTITYED